MPNTYFTSDLHLGHAGILEYRVLPEWVKAIEQHDDIILDGIAKTVRHGDTLVCAGDFCWKASKAGHYRQRLPRGVQLHMVAGNHDAPSLAKHCSTFQHLMHRKFGGHRFVVCHYPLWTWNGQHDGVIHLYGHSHGRSADTLSTVQPDARRLDIGVDSALHILGEMRPFSLDEVLSIVPKWDGETS